MSTTVAPDLEFIRSLKTFGGENLKSCYQCATCSVVCPISTDDRPFPRPEMIHAQWGMKDKLLSDPLVWVCHNCRDCSSYCPRGAKPGELLAAVRDYSITHFAWPRGFARLFNDAKYLPLLFAIPVIVLFVSLGIEGHLHIPEGKIVYSKLFPIHLVEYLYIPVTFFGFIAGLMGMRRYWTAISAHRAGETPHRTMVEAAILTGKEILSHTQFRKCSVEGKRYFGHLPMFYGFLGAFATTTMVTLYYYLFGRLTPLPLYDPVKILGNVSAVLLLYGCFRLIARRKEEEPEERNNLPSSYFDWLFLGLLTAVAVTGTLTELTRLSGAAGIAYPTYFIHLSLIFMLLGYMPYSKFAHLFYRTAAMVHEKMYAQEEAAVVLPAPPELPPVEVEEEEEEEVAAPAAAGVGAPAATSPLGGGGSPLGGGGAPPSMFGGSKIGGGAPPTSSLGGGSKIGGGAPPSAPLGGGGGIGGTPPPAPGGGSKIGGSPPPAGGSTIGGSPPPPAGGSKIGGSPPPPPGGSKIGGSPPPPAPGGSKIGGTPPPPAPGGSKIGGTPPAPPRPMFGGVTPKPPAPPAPPAEEEAKEE